MPLVPLAASCFVLCDVPCPASSHHGHGAHFFRAGAIFRAGAHFFLGRYNGTLIIRYPASVKTRATRARRTLDFERRPEAGVSSPPARLLAPRRLRVNMNYGSVDIQIIIELSVDTIVNIMHLKLKQNLSLRAHDT